MYDKVKGILDSAFGCDCILNIPKDSQMGHFATPLAFSLAKSLKKNPNEIAVELKEKLVNLPQFRQVEVINGYVNLHLSDEFLAQMARDILKNGDLQGESQCKSQKILLEFVSANPTGPLHIGHARGAIWGDTLARIGRFLGHTIITEYYINDAGSQIENLMLSVLNALGYAQFSDTEAQNLYKGEYITDLADSAKAHFGTEFFKNSTNLANLKDFCVNQMLDLIKANLKSANIKFDNFIS